MNNNKHKCGKRSENNFVSNYLYFDYGMSTLTPALTSLLPLSQGATSASEMGIAPLNRELNVYKYLLVFIVNNARHSYHKCATKKLLQSLISLYRSLSLAL